MQSRYPFGYVVTYERHMGSLMKLITCPALFSEASAHSMTYSRASSAETPSTCSLNAALVETPSKGSYASMIRRDSSAS